MTGEQIGSKWSSKKQGKAASDDYRAEFVNIDLSDEQRQACKTWDFSGDAFSEAVNALVGEGYVLTVKPEGATGAYLALLRAPQAGVDNQGLILSGRGSTAAKAVKQLMFKHYVVAMEDWRPFFEQRAWGKIDD